MYTGVCAAIRRVQIVVARISQPSRELCGPMRYHGGTLARWQQLMLLQLNIDAVNATRSSQWRQPTLVPVARSVGQVCLTVLCEPARLLLNSGFDRGESYLHTQPEGNFHRIGVHLLPAPASMTAAVLVHVNYATLKAAYVRRPGGPNHTYEISSLTYKFQCSLTSLFDTSLSVGADQTTPSHYCTAAQCPPVSSVRKSRRSAPELC